MQDWKAIVRQLCDCFQEKEERLQFLHEIDRKILNQTMSLEEICVSVLKDILRFSQTDIGYFYILSGTEFLLLGSSQDNEITEQPVIDGALLVDKLKTASFFYEEFDNDNESLFPTFLEESATRIIVPIIIGDSVWGMMCFESNRATASSPLSEKDTQDFFQIIGDQLAIAIQIRSQYDDLTQLSKIQNELFTRELDITESLKSLINNIIFALPSIKPLRIHPDPEIQLLFFEQGDEYLTIRATSGSEIPSTRISIDKSISGYLIQNPTLPFFLCDPRDYLDRYKNYLEVDSEGKQDKEIRTELVVSIKWDNKIIGMINLEAEIENAFKEQHITAMLRLAEKISPIINALQKRSQKTQIQDLASTYSMNRFLSRFARTYSHKMGSPISDVSLNLNMLVQESESAKEINDQFKNSVRQKLNSSLEAVELIDEYHHGFCNNLPNYLTFGRHSVNTLVQDAINELRPETLKSKYSISVMFTPPEDYEVFCSSFLREHMFNVLNNSAYAILERKKSDEGYKGKIQIEISSEIDKIESRLNKRCHIKIRDNGTGVDEATLNKLPSPFMTTKGNSGSGFGLFAASQYLKSIGGRLELSSKLGEFFEVNMYLDIFEDSVHSKEIFSPLYKEVE